MAFKTPEYIISKDKIFAVNAYDPILNEYSVRDMERQISITIKKDNCRCATGTEIMKYLETLENKLKNENRSQQKKT